MANSNVPSTIFIVPYRDRERDKAFFLKMIPRYIEMSDCCEDLRNNYKIIFAHQCDKRNFNRGATKNIGFLAMKKMYPQHYKDITFIFHDIDTIPKEVNIIPYKTTPGKVSHYYGVTFALGGIFAIKGADFEKTGGFPNFWGWGLEDNSIQKRCLDSKLEIDRSVFITMRDMEKIYRSNDGVNRIMSRRDQTVYKYEYVDNMHDLKNVNWTLNDQMLNITSFEPKMSHDQQDFYNYDIRQGSRIVTKPGTFRRNWSFRSMVAKK